MQLTDSPIMMQLPHLFVIYTCHCSSDALLLFLFQRLINTAQISTFSYCAILLKNFGKKAVICSLINSEIADSIISNDEKQLKINPIRKYI